MQLQKHGMEAKAAERKAVERRRVIEDHLASLLGVG